MFPVYVYVFLFYFFPPIKCYRCAHSVIVYTFVCLVLNLCWLLFVCIFLITLSWMNASQMPYRKFGWNQSILMIIKKCTRHGMWFSSNGKRKIPSVVVACWYHQVLYLKSIWVLVKLYVYQEQILLWMYICLNDIFAITL